MDGLIFEIGEFFLEGCVEEYGLVKSGEFELIGGVEVLRGKVEVERGEGDGGREGEGKHFEVLLGLGGREVVRGSNETIGGSKILVKEIVVKVSTYEAWVIY